MGIKCEIKKESCGFNCTSFDGKLSNGKSAWGEIDKVIEKIPCETCRDDGKRRVSALHDIVNLGIGETKKPFNKMNLKKFIDEANCVYSKCKAEGNCL